MIEWLRLLTNVVSMAILLYIYRLFFPNKSASHDTVINLLKVRIKSIKPP
jgi:hypothetical protein